MSEALLHNAIRLHDSGNLLEAARLYSDIIRANPTHFEALHRLAFIHLQSGRAADAEHLFAAAIKVNPRVAEAFYGRGCALQSMQRHEDALRAFAQALALRPDYLEARNNRGVTLLTLQRYDEALQSFDKIVPVRPDLAIVHSNRAAALLGLGRNGDALGASERALAAGGGADAWYNKGAALAGLLRYRDAVAAFDQALAPNPHYLEALTYRGIALAMLEHHDAAVLSFNQGLVIAPGSIDLLYNRGTSLLALQRYDEALADFEKVLAADPAYKYARGCLVHCKLQLCDWRELEPQKQKIAAELQAGKRVARPLQNVLISTSEPEQLRCAHIWTANDCPPSDSPRWRGEIYRHSKIKVAYVSADFRAHAVASLMAGAFEQHDRSRFETVAISLLKEPGEMRSRLADAFDESIDADEMSDAEVAALVRRLEIDIAVDLMGYTRASRTRIFALRPAPIQVHYLGFPGTMGADYIDYMIADGIAVPRASAAHYAEKLVYLPHSFMAGDDKRSTGRALSRGEAGLPESAFVFCSFNNPAKIVPPTFDVWMRLLGRSEGSVLWLSAAGRTCMRNLRNEATARGINPDRLVFAPFLAEQADHLARLSLGDMFLDTLPYNAHAGASDALWAGVPIISCTGSTFAGRVGTSLLHAIGLPELVTSSLEDYEAAAVRLTQ